MATCSACAFQVSGDMSYSTMSRVGGRVAKSNGLYSGNAFRHLWNLAHNLGTSGLPEVLEMFCWTVVMVAQLDEFTKNL